MCRNQRGQTLDLLLIHFGQNQQPLQPFMARHKPERSRQLTFTHAIQSLKARPYGFTQIAGTSLWPSQRLEEFNSFQQWFADVGGFGADVSQNDQIRIKALLLTGHLGATDEPVLLQFTLNRIA